jgi:plasmid rolling circle replication initiator protein Rep
MLAAPTAELGDRPLLGSVPAMARFTKRKHYHDPIAKLLRQAPEFVEMARSIQNCGDALEVLLELPEGGDPFAMLTDYNPCNRRACPMCEWRRSLVWRGRLMPGLDAFFDQHPTHRAIFVTLTVRNVPLGELRQSIKDIHAAWNRLLQWREFPTEFWFRRTEFTIGQPSFTDDLPRAPRSRANRKNVVATSPCETPQAQGLDSRISMCEPVPGAGIWVHPHIHALLLVPASYFSHGYITQGEWQRQWMMAGRLDYSPVVDIRRAAAKFTTGEAFYDAKAAGIEAMKYAVKATDMLKMAADLPEFIHQTRGHRLVAMSRKLRAFVPDHDPQAGEMADDRLAGLPRLHPGISCLAQWDRSLSDYVLTPR